MALYIVVFILDVTLWPGNHKGINLTLEIKHTLNFKKLRRDYEI